MELNLEVLFTFRTKATIVKTLLFIKILLIVLLSINPGDIIQAQDSDEIQTLKIKQSNTTETYVIEYTHKGNNEIILMTGQLFRFYKKYISSQDHGSCSFTPSCSVYAMVSISEQGLLLGTINTLDRLSRCNGRNNRHYPQETIKGLSIDEVRNHKYEKN